MTDFFKQKVTIYNDIASDGVNPRRFDRFVVDLCNIQKGAMQNADGTIEKVPNAIMIETKDINPKFLSVTMNRNKYFLQTVVL